MGQNGPKFNLTSTPSKGSINTKLYYRMIFKTICTLLGGHDNIIYTRGLHIAAPISRKGFPFPTYLQLYKLGLQNLALRPIISRKGFPFPTYLHVVKRALHMF